eukprot:7217507-Pyramimonas_sp.AAC.1
MTVPTVESDRLQDFGLRACVQEFEVWRSQAVNRDTESLDVFVGPPPGHVDLLAMLGTAPEDRQAMCSWRSGLSDVDGCMLLFDRRPVAPQMALMDASCPVLCLAEDA